MTSVDLSQNPLCSLEVERLPRSTRQLSLLACGLQALPEQLISLTNLEAIALGANQYVAPAIARDCARQTVPEPCS